MKVLDLMGPAPPSVSLRTSLFEAAEIMTRLGTSMVPVCDDGRFVGLLTDRMIVLNAFAEGHDPRSTRIAELMPLEAISLTPEQTTGEARRVMEEAHLKRIPVVDATQRLIGSLALIDLLAAAPAVSSSPAASVSATSGSAPPIPASSDTADAEAVPENASTAIS